MCVCIFTQSSICMHTCAGMCGGHRQMGFYSSIVFNYVLGDSLSLNLNSLISYINKKISSRVPLFSAPQECYCLLVYTLASMRIVGIHPQFLCLHSRDITDWVIPSHKYKKFSYIPNGCVEQWPSTYEDPVISVLVFLWQKTPSTEQMSQFWIAVVAILFLLLTSIINAFMNWNNAISSIMSASLG